MIPFNHQSKDTYEACGIKQSDVTEFSSDLTFKYMEFKKPRYPSHVAESIELLMIENEVSMRAACIIALMCIRAVKESRKNELTKEDVLLMPTRKVGPYDHENEGLLEACCITFDEVVAYIDNIIMVADEAEGCFSKVVEFMEEKMSTIERRIIAFLATQEILHETNQGNQNE